MTPSWPGRAPGSNDTYPSDPDTVPDAAHGGRVMALALHPFVTGQAFRAKYFDQALEFLSRQPGIWLTTSDEIAEHDQRTAGPAHSGSHENMNPATHS
jgi:hypothetical protein